MEEDNQFAPFFLGSYAENNDVFEASFLEFYRDHAYWRRSFHPEDQPPIDVTTKYQPHFLANIAKTQQALHQLTAKLKQSVPFYHPRYIGHMSSDLLMPGLLAQMVTTLYNPNNVCAESAPVTVDLELDYGLKLARMFGFNSQANDSEQAFGHLTSGGSVANYQGLWYAHAIKYYPLALARAIEHESDIRLDIEGINLCEMTAWQLFNLSFESTLALQQAFKQQLSVLPAFSRQTIHNRVEQNRIEQLGSIHFHQQYPTLKPPVILVPSTGHYSWQKAAKLMGIGCAQIIQVRTDDKMRLCAKELAKTLQDCVDRQQPILSVIGILGTTEFGTIDPIDALVDLRQHFRALGLGFFIHVDAAWGGFLTTLFRDEQGQFMPRSEVAPSCQYFPSEHVYNAFKALSQVETITVDPHKLGYLPFGCGAFVCKHKAAREFVSQSAAYVFDNDEQRNSDLQLGQYILEGSKSGAVAAGAYVAEQVLPFHAQALGRLPEHSVSVTEYFYDRVQQLNQRITATLRISVPIEPDSNLICLAFNQLHNQSAAQMNAFIRSVYEQLRVDTKTPLQNKAFFASCTKIYRQNLSEQAAKSICEGLALDVNTFVHKPVNDDQSDHLFILRHTLMNPWLKAQPDSYIDQYLDFLEQHLLFHEPDNGQT